MPIRLTDVWSRNITRWNETTTDNDEQYEQQRSAVQLATHDAPKTREGCRLNKPNGAPSLTHNMMTHFKKVPRIVENSVRGVVYDLQHYSAIPIPKRQSRLQYILTRDSRGPYLLSTLIGVVFIILLFFCMVDVCRSAATTPRRPAFVTAFPIAKSVVNGVAGGSAMSSSFFTVHPDYGLARIVPSSSLSYSL